MSWTCAAVIIFMLATVWSVSVGLKHRSDEGWSEWQKAMVIAKLGRNALQEITESATADYDTKAYAHNMLNEIDRIAASQGGHPHVPSN